MTTFGPNVERWRSAVDDYGCSLGTDYVLAFIEHESGGNPWDTTGMHFADGTLREVGIGQVDFGDHPNGTVAGVTRAQLLDGSPGGLRGGGAFDFEAASDTCKQANVSSVCDEIDAFADQARGELDAAGADWDGVDFGRLVKMRHNLPLLAEQVKRYTSANGRPAVSWDEWRAWCEGDGADQLDARLRAFAPLGRLFDNAEAVASRAGLTSDSPTGAGLVGGELIVPALAVVVALTRGSS